MDIHETILQKLRDIEQAEHVTVLHAVESGSRAWGFASPDSDYDVRFIYVRRTPDYLKLEPCSDVIEWQLDETLDINGWDLQKALRLLYKSNPTLFEWNQSPLIYRTTYFWQGLHETVDRYFSGKAGLYHYLHMAKTNNREYLHGETVRLKKYFYVIRPILACRWILERSCPPPMRFTELMDAVLDPAIRPIMEQLTARKMQTPEIGLGPRIPELNAYIAESIAELTQKAAEIAPDRNPDWKTLDRIFAAGIAFGEQNGQ